MKAFSLALALLALSLGGCASVDVNSAADITAKIKAVQGYTQTACKFVPTFATVAAIFNAAVGEGIATVGGGICSAIATVPLADGPGRAVPLYRGVEIKGKRV